MTALAFFPAWLRDRLRARAWSIADLAAQIGVHPTTVQRWLSGQRAPLDPQVARIAKVLDLAPSEVWAVLARDGAAPFGGPASPPPTRERAAPANPADRPFARWLRDQLAERGSTAGKLARAIDVYPVTVQKWAKGVSTPASVHLPGLAAALGLDIRTIRDVLSRADSEESV